MSKNEIIAEFCKFEEARIDDFINNLQKAKEEAIKAGYTMLRIDISTEQERWEDHSYAKVSLVGHRLETDEEYEERIQYEERSKEMRRAQFEMLSKEFGK